MASAQVLPISAKKQEQLEAGKRKLEEYRKKRAALGQGKKAPSMTASKNSLNNTNTDLHEKQPLENGQVRYTGFDEAGLSDRVDVPLTEISHVAKIKNDKVSENLQNIKVLSDDSIATAAEVSMNSHGLKRDDTSLPSIATTTDEDDQLKAMINENDNSGTGSGKTNNKIFGDRLITNDHPVHGTTESSLQNEVVYTRPLNRDGEKVPAPSFHKVPKHEIEKKGPLVSSSEISADNGNTAPNRYDAQAYGFGSDKKSSFSQESSYPVLETNLSRSRPSFLDSISIQRVSSASQSYPEQMKAHSYSGNTQGKDNQDASASHRTFAEAVQPAWMLVASGVNHHTNSLVSTVNGDKIPSMPKDRMKNKGGYYSHKQDEDFATLEQHIEDLTQEKFSLQRTLESSRALAESLAAENSGLTDSYNQQGNLVNQLKSEIGSLQEEIKALLVEVESLKMEYANTQLECNAADERAKLLASEVIGLEEKVLRLRSNELKLERQLEKSEAEISSQKKKMSSFENERRDFQLTIDAMQEEKKLLQSKVWKTSKIEKFADVGESSDNRKDVSTSTEDLDGVDNAADALNQVVTIATHPGSDDSASSSSLHPENTQFNPQFQSSSIPHDQLRMIQNIDTLLSELTLEKEELLQNLLVESSQSSKLKELNKELSRKLESQTQRLELLTAQTMANGNISARRPDLYTVSENNTAYADEGDEVVERVLGWIMKLIPGGPTRRRPSKIH